MARFHTQNAALAFLALAAALLAGCGSITAWLWERDESTPPLHIETQECRIHDVRGRITTGRNARNRLAVTFSTKQDFQTPTHLWTYDRTRPGRLLLRPPNYLSEPDWLTLPGAERFRINTYGLRTFRGDYFLDGGVRARIEFLGTVDSNAVVRRVRKEDLVLPSKRQQETTRTVGPVPGVLDGCLDAFAHHRWADLVDQGSLWNQYYDQVPVGFAGEDGKVLTRRRLNQALSKLDKNACRELLATTSLIARLDSALGDRIYVAVPLPVLLQGRELSMQRRGKKVQFVRSQIWHGRLEPAEPRSNRLPPVRLALATPSFQYRYGREARSGTLFQDVIAAVLTPAALVADFAIQSSWLYPRVLYWAIKKTLQGQPRGPFGGRRDR